MGSVWIARHRDLEIDVNVKFMAPTLVRRSRRGRGSSGEARSLPGLRSQHVVQIHDYGVEDGTPYIVMELLTGESLATRLTRDGQLPVPVTARLVVQICKALRTAHDAGLVHRDLKPANIFLALEGRGRGGQGPRLRHRQGGRGRGRQGGHRVGRACSAPSIHEPGADPELAHGPTTGAISGQSA